MEILRQTSNFAALRAFSGRRDLIAFSDMLVGDTGLHVLANGLLGTFVGDE